MSGLLAPAVLALGLAGVGQGEFNFEAVEPEIGVSEAKKQTDIWVLNFTFRKPRFITVNVPGRGRERVWYMRYKVTNYTDAPHTFLPRFTLVTDKGEKYDDVILPRAEKSVVAREDPTLRNTGVPSLKLYNSVTIAENEIPPTAADETPKERNGVAFWTGVDPSCKAFTVYVTGLSNGYTRVAEEGQDEEIRRKTLKLEFLKLGDVYDLDEDEIQYTGEWSWPYR